jgi:hypothetical protein
MISGAVFRLTKQCRINSEYGANQAHLLHPPLSLFRGSKASEILGVVSKQFSVRRFAGETGDV